MWNSSILTHSLKYVFREGTIVSLNDTVLQISSGIWNYHSTSIEFKSSWRDILQYFIQEASENGISVEQLRNKHNLNDNDLSEIIDVFTRLQTDGFLLNKEYVNRSIFNTLSFLGYRETETDQLDMRHIPQHPQVTILTNITNFKEIIAPYQYEKWLDAEIIDIDNMSELFQFDATKRTDAPETLSFLNRYSNLTKRNTALVVLSYPHPILLRNLNRLFLHYNIKWTLSTLDGPFLMMTSFIPKQTGCFECLETRILSQMRSMDEYKLFISRITQKKPYTKQIILNPLLHLLISFAMNECIFLSGFNASHFVGRLLSIYTPFYEIQMPDVLRNPICSACGHTNESTMEELFFDFRRVLTDVSKKIDNDESSLDK